MTEPSKEAVEAVENILPASASNLRVNMADEIAAAVIEVERERWEEETKSLVSDLQCYLRLAPGETHKGHGKACGIDLCILCLAEAKVEELAAVFEKGGRL